MSDTTYKTVHTALAAAIDSELGNAIRHAVNEVKQRRKASRGIMSVEVASAELRRAALAEAKMEGLMHARRIAKRIAVTMVVATPEVADKITQEQK